MSEPLTPEERAARALRHAPIYPVAKEAVLGLVEVEIRAAVEAEREACAVVADRLAERMSPRARDLGSPSMPIIMAKAAAGRVIANQIRERGKEDTDEPTTRETHHRG